MDGDSDAAFFERMQRKIDDMKRMSSLEREVEALTKDRDRWRSLAERIGSDITITQDTSVPTHKMSLIMSDEVVVLSRSPEGCADHMAMRVHHELLNHYRKRGWIKQSGWVK